MGGAKNCPETPRQKMIGMMYLVLTAMLALNVSTDILNGFKLVDDSLHSSLDATENRNMQMMENFRLAASENPDKNQSWYNIAMEMNTKSDSLFDYIHNFKYEIAKIADGAKDADPTVRNITNTSNLDAAGEYALTGIHGYNGIILREKIDAYRKYLITLSPRDSAEFNTLFATPEGKNADGDPISWEASLFDNMPIGASITLLTKIQNDIRTAQSEIIQHLQISTDASDLRVNKMEAFAVPESRNVISGDKYRAHIVLAAIDTTQKPTYYINGTRIGDDGIYEISTNATGTFKYQGELRIKDNGIEKSYMFDSEYSVSAPMATISNKDLNAMYRGYPHKFGISVPGVTDPDRIRVEAKNNTASIAQSGNEWTITPTKNAKVDNVRLVIKANFDGEWREMGTQDYRLYPLPEPAVSLMADKEYKNLDEISVSALTKQNATVIAGLGADVLISLDYTVTAFTLVVNRRPFTVQGNKFTTEQKNQLQKVRSKETITIRDVKVKDKLGNVLELGGVALNIK